MGWVPLLDRRPGLVRPVAALGLLIGTAVLVSGWYAGQGVLWLAAALLP